MEEEEDVCDNMKVKSFNFEKDNVVVFSFSGSNVKFANFLRRTLISGVPIIAVDSITFYENSSMIFDEYIAHRLGLIPLSMPSKYKVDGEYMFILDESGSKNIYSGDLKPVDHKVKPAIDNIPILRLSEGQLVRLEAKATVGTGKQHAKFQASIATYDFDEKSGDINFRLETFFQMAPKVLISKALDVMDKELSILEKAIKKIK